MRPTDFWPFWEETICVRCLQPVNTRDAVAVVNADNTLAGMAHDGECPE